MYTICNCIHVHPPFLNRLLPSFCSIFYSTFTRVQYLLIWFNFTFEVVSACEFIPRAPYASNFHSKWKRLLNVAQLAQAWLTKAGRCSAQCIVLTGDSGPIFVERLEIRNLVDLKWRSIHRPHAWERCLWPTVFLRKRITQKRNYPGIRACYRRRKEGRRWGWGSG